MKPSPFEYHLPDTLDEALDLMAEHGDAARPLAGGQSLVPMMAFRLARPSVVVDLNQLSDLTRIEASGVRVVLGAMVRERAAERSETLARSVPLIAWALPLIGHEAIRTRGTVGGSLAHCDPAGELPAVAVATGATITARSQRRGERTIPAEEFFLGHFTSALADDELLTHVSFPAAGAGNGAAFEEMSRRHGDFAVVGVACQLRVTDGIINDARVVLTGVAEIPFRATRAETVLVGATADAASFQEAADAVSCDIDPPSDLHGTAAYRRYVAGVLTRRALRKAVVETVGGT
jgi:carbon-monoxide dehydrogenase medium subunit